MPNRIIPPGSAEASKTVTSYPRRARSWAADIPAGPAPTTATLRRVVPAAAGEGRHREVPAVEVALEDRLLQEPVLRAGAARLDAVLLGDVPLQGADRDGLVDVAAPAGVLAGRGAHAAADRGEGIGRPRDEEGLLVTPLGDQLDVAAGVGLDGAAGLALDLRLPVLEVGELHAHGHVSPRVWWTVLRDGRGGYDGRHARGNRGRVEAGPARRRGRENGGFQGDSARRDGPDVTPAGQGPAPPPPSRCWTQPWP